MKRGLILVILMALIGGLIAACAAPAPAPAPAPVPTPAPASQPEAPTVTWNSIYDGMGPQDRATLPWLTLRDNVLARTNGKFTINMVAEGELGIKREGFLQALETQTVEIAWIAAGFAEPTWPHQGVLTLPFLASSLEEGQQMMLAIAPVNDRGYAELGLTSLAPYVWVPTEFFVKEEVDLTALDGLRIRGWTKVMMDWINIAGGVATPIPSPELYLAAQRGVIDGMMSGLATGLSASWWEVAPYVYPLHFFYMTAEAVMNKAAFAELPKEYQDILLDEAKTFREGKFTEAKQTDLVGWDEWEENGGTVVDLSPELREALRKQVEPLWDEWLENTPTGQEALDTIKNALGI